MIWEIGQGLRCRTAAFCLDFIWIGVDEDQELILGLLYI